MREKHSAYSAYLAYQRGKLLFGHGIETFYGLNPELNFNLN